MYKVCTQETQLCMNILSERQAGVCLFMTTTPSSSEQLSSDMKSGVMASQYCNSQSLTIFVRLS